MEHRVQAEPRYGTVSLAVASIPQKAQSFASHQSYSKHKNQLEEQDQDLRLGEFCGRTNGDPETFLRNAKVAP
jgi:hypothetical protein